MLPCRHVVLCPAARKKVSPPRPVSSIPLLLRFGLAFTVFANGAHHRRVSAIHLDTERFFDISVVQPMRVRFPPAEQTNLVRGWQIDERRIEGAGVRGMRAQQTNAMGALRAHAT